MADGISITAGSGTTILTDDTGASGHAQVVKLAISTDGSGTLIPADATDGMLVNLGANNDVTISGTVTLAAGTNNIGDVDVLSVVPGTGATNLGKAEDTAHVDGDVGVMMLGVVNNAPSAVTGDYATFSIGTNGGLAIAGCTAHDAVDAGSPAKIGAKAESSPAGATLVADGDRTDVYADLDGLLITKPFTAYGDILVERLSNTDGNSTASTVFGATASARNCITTIAVYNDSTTNGYIDFRDGTAGTILFTLPLPAKGGAVTNFPLPLRQTTANTAFAYDVSAALTTVYISLIGFKSKA